MIKASVLTVIVDHGLQMVFVCPIVNAENAKGPRTQIVGLSDITPFAPGDTGVLEPIAPLAVLDIDLDAIWLAVVDITVIS